MTLYGGYAGYIGAAYGIGVLVLAGLAAHAWREWRRVAAAWDAAARRRGPNGGREA